MNRACFWSGSLGSHSLRETVQLREDWLLSEEYKGNDKMGFSRAILR